MWVSLVNIGLGIVILILVYASITYQIIMNVPQKVFPLFSLTLYFITLKNGQTYFQNVYSHRKIFKVCLTIFQHYEKKG